jgi:Tol biopolymer transport system component
MHITQLTKLPGSYGWPTFSPDGKQIAFIWDEEKPTGGDLYVQLVGGEKPLRLTHTSSGYMCCTDWSPDGQQIVFGRCDDNGGHVYTIPALGGTERKITDVVCPVAYAGYAKWTADGKSLVLADRCAPDAASGIVVLSLQTGERRCLHSPPPSAFGDCCLLLSPDQKTVAFLSGTTIGFSKLYTVAISGGDLRQLSDQTFSMWMAMMWSADSKYLTFEPESGRMARVAASGGPIEFEAIYPRIGTLSRDGRRLAFTQTIPNWSDYSMVWRLRLSRAGGRVVSQTRILAPSTPGEDSAQLSPDETQLVFHSMRSGTEQLWKSNADGSDPLQLTSFDSGYPGTPRWSPDGKWIAFDYRHDIHSQIYLMDVEGHNLHAITSGNYDNNTPGWSRDGKNIYFASDRTREWQVWKHELSTGKETQVTQHGGFLAYESYDAKNLYYSKFQGGGIWTMPVGGGQAELITDALHLGYWGHFAVTDKGIYLLDSDAKGGPAIKYCDLQRRRLSSVVTLKQPLVSFYPNLAASRDGRTLFYAQVAFPYNNISMVENFQ